MTAAAELLADLNGRGIVLSARAGTLGYDAPKGAMTAEVRARIGTHKAGLLALLRTAQGEPLAGKPTAEPMAAAGAAQAGPAIDVRGYLRTPAGLLYAPTVTGGWVLVEHPGFAMAGPGTIAIGPDGALRTRAGCSAQREVKGVQHGSCSHVPAPANQPQGGPGRVDAPPGAL